MINKKDKLTLEKETDFEFSLLKKWALLENGTILNSYWVVQDYEGEPLHKEYRMTNIEKDGSISMLFNLWQSYGNYRIHATCYGKLLATADTKRELIEYKRELGIKKKPVRRKISKRMANLIKNLAEK